MRKIETFRGFTWYQWIYFLFNHSSNFKINAQPKKNRRKLFQKYFQFYTMLLYWRKIKGNSDPPSPIPIHIFGGGVVNFFPLEKKKNLFFLVVLSGSTTKISISSLINKKFNKRCIFPNLPGNIEMNEGKKRGLWYFKISQNGFFSLQTIKYKSP